MEVHAEEKEKESKELKMKIIAAARPSHSND